MFLWIEQDFYTLALYLSLAPCLLLHCSTLTLLCGQASRQEHCLTAFLFPQDTPQPRAWDPSFLLPLEQPFTVLFIKNHISGGRTVEARMELEAGGTVEEMESGRIGLHALEAAAWMQGGVGVGGLNQSCVWHLVKQTGHHRHDILQLHPIYRTEEMERDGRQLALWPLAHWTEQKRCWLRDRAALGQTVLGQPKLNAPA